MNSRIESLDWLRGLMALSIMLYHIAGHNNAASLLGRLGLYGVAIFFILSGLSMAIVYDRHIDGLKSAGIFLIRRLFRIWPLMWLAISLVVIPGYFIGKEFSLQTVFLNFTTLFSFVSSGNYINMGAWSIGNEMVYYAMTPLLIATYRYNARAGDLIVLGSVIIGFLFAFRILDPNISLADQWLTYINPFNNLFLYCAGIAIYYRCPDWRGTGKWGMLFPVLAIVAFALYPVSGDQINIATGINRIALALISILIVMGFYRLPQPNANPVSWAFEKLGIATYGVYLLHPIVTEWLQRLLKAIGYFHPFIFAPLVIGITIILALATFKYIETPLIVLGKRITRTTPVVPSPA
jgi:exopolysaccharide production protein ExoZ